jgi:hypothetical protein
MAGSGKKRKERKKEKVNVMGLHDLGDIRNRFIIFDRSPIKRKSKLGGKPTPQGTLPIF